MPSDYHCGSYHDVDHSDADYHDVDYHDVDHTGTFGPMLHRGRRMDRLPNTNRSTMCGTIWSVGWWADLCVHALHRRVLLRDSFVRDGL